jgi:N-acetylglutamate synthase-like GNAT family acetyltransferase
MANPSVFIPSSPGKRTEFIITLSGLIGALIFFIFFEQVFPSAALNLERSPQQISHLAHVIVSSYGHDLKGYENAQSFGSDFSSSAYFQRMLGIPKANQLIVEQDLPIWYWRARWYKPLQKEGVSIYLSPAGKIVGFSHTIEEDAIGASLPVDAALELAENYLVEQIGWKMADWEQVSSSSMDRPGGRTDHFFDYKLKNFFAAESELHISIGIQGDRLGSYDHWIKIPEAYQRQFAEQNNRAGFIADLALSLSTYSFGLVAVVVLAWSMLRRARFHRAGFLISMILGLLSLLNNLNALPLNKAYYPTTVPYGQFWFNNLTTAVISAVFDAMLVWFLWLAGERLSKLVWPRQDKLLKRQGDFWNSLSLSAWRGLMLAGIQGGFIVLFYWVATRILGGWVPMGIQYSDLYATPFPFLSPLISGLNPALVEELFFRLIGVGMLFGLTRRPWLSLFIPGVLWAFAHLTYVRDPFYMRGIELTFVAVFLLGWFFLRYDLTTVIVAHMTYNAMLGALPMLRSSEPYFIFNGALIVIVLISPIVPGTWETIRKKLLKHKTGVSFPMIKPAMVEDIAGLNSLVVEHQYQHKIPDWNNRLNDPQSVTLCLKMNGNITGVALGKIIGENGKLEWIYVSPPWRDQYHGSRLMDALNDTFTKHGSAHVETLVQSGDRRSAGFLNGLGWEPQAQIFVPGHPPSLPGLFAELLSPFRITRARKKKI